MRDGRNVLKSTESLACKSSMTLTIFVILLLVWLVVFAPRPRLGRPGSAAVPIFEDLRDLSIWLDDRERQVPGIVPGAAACIQFAAPDAPAKTPLCFMYVHGFSATWPETAPVTTKLAEKFGANVLQTRLEGHGRGQDYMVTPAEDWLGSLLEAFRIANQLGDRIVIVATSTGAPLSVWLTDQEETRGAIAALLFMSPNFGIRSKYDFLLTWPFSKYWIRYVVGEHREWEPINELQAKYWTFRYSTRALIEMQKIVDWANKQDHQRYDCPVAMMYMKNDPTIDPERAIVVFRRWGTGLKRLIEVAPEGDKAEHVFAGDITAPHRTDWVVAQFSEFLAQLPER